MSDFSNYVIPSADSVDYDGTKISRGKHYFTATKFEYSESKSKGTPQMVVTWTCDSGKHAGQTMTEWFTWFVNDNAAFGKLSYILRESNPSLPEYDSGMSIKEFHLQFVPGTIRSLIDVDWRFTMKDDDGVYHNISEDKYESYDGPNKKYINYDVKKHYAVVGSGPDGSTPMPELLFNTQDEKYSDVVSDLPFDGNKKVF
jgi:hypothetical protein